LAHARRMRAQVAVELPLAADFIDGQADETIPVSKLLATVDGHGLEAGEGEHFADMIQQPVVEIRGNAGIDFEPDLVDDALFRAREDRQCFHVHPPGFLAGAYVNLWRRRSHCKARAGAPSGESG